MGKQSMKTRPGTDLNDGKTFSSSANLPVQWWPHDAETMDVKTSWSDVTAPAPETKSCLHAHTPGETPRRHGYRRGKEGDVWGSRTSTTDLVYCVKSVCSSGDTPAKKVVFEDTYTYTVLFGSGPGLPKPNKRKVKTGVRHPPVDTTPSLFVCLFPLGTRT